jgi:DNA-binding Xre family transcriptional regulator
MCGLSTNKLAMRVGLQLGKLRDIEKLVAVNITVGVLTTICVELTCDPKELALTRTNP